MSVGGTPVLDHTNFLYGILSGVPWDRHPTVGFHLIQNVVIAESSYGCSFEVVEESEGAWDAYLKYN